MNTFEENSNVDTYFMKKAAVYGAIQRLLDRVNKKYPYLGDEMYELDYEHGTLPERFWLTIGLQPFIAEFRGDYRECDPETGNVLLRELLET